MQQSCLKMRTHVIDHMIEQVRKVKKNMTQMNSRELKSPVKNMIDRLDVKIIY